MAQDAINAWVRQKTMGKIDNILTDVPPPDTTLILLSALYFNGEWNQHFFNGATRRFVALFQNMSSFVQYIPSRHLINFL